MVNLVNNPKTVRDISSLDLSVGAGLPAMNDLELRNLRWQIAGKPAPAKQ